MCLQEVCRPIRNPVSMKRDRLLSLRAYRCVDHTVAVTPALEVLKLGTRRSDRSWDSGEAEEDDFDPFADVS